MTLSALGITPKTPLGARVTLGRQPPDNLGNGYPIAKDRLWIMGVKPNQPPCRVDPAIARNAT
jgi:hypothetical protein